MRTLPLQITLLIASIFGLQERNVQSGVTEEGRNAQQNNINSLKDSGIHLSDTTLHKLVTAQGNKGTTATGSVSYCA